MKSLKYHAGELAVVNENAKGLPDCIGKVVTVTSDIDYPSNYDYYVKRENHKIFKVKESELDQLGGEEIYLYLSMKEHGKAVYHPTGETVKVMNTDFLHKQIEVQYNDNAMQVVDLNLLDPFEEDDVLNNIQVSDFHEEMLHMFLGHYKNSDDTYTLPKELLLNILKGTFEEV